MKRSLLLFGLLMTLTISSGLWAQQAAYSQTNLVSNIAGVAETTDSQLLNPLGHFRSSWARFLDRRQQQRRLHVV